MLILYHGCTWSVVSLTPGLLKECITHRSWRRDRHVQQRYQSCPQYALTGIHHLPDELLDRYPALCAPVVREPLRRLVMP
ncbi:hypothetical protein [Kushneria sinocarnis]|uniref:hypothetical protein n=1 Tax=Kushneria sinocarnis TaxID=595502 RepID=UPI0011C4A9AD|nr:hypothetical protein [Kushneria sinocarnis]